jgi:hypothetical protein
VTIKISIPIDLSVAAMNEVANWTDEELVQQLNSVERMKMFCDGDASYYPLLIEAITRCLQMKAQIRL